MIDFSTSFSRSFLSLCVCVMLGAGLGACKKASEARAGSSQGAGERTSFTPPADQYSIGQTIAPPSDTRAQASPGQKPQALVLPLGFCSFFPGLPGCPVKQEFFPGESQVSNFGSNPGNLTMIWYIPKNLGSARPLVVALHGCTQSATSYDNETGWIRLADQLKFALLLPQQDQIGLNNAYKCFRWFDANHNQRGKGEALSIKQMIDTMLADTALNIDSKRVYVTGLSAGGAMTVVMLAAYPDIFAGGGPIAGIPYGCAQTSTDATSKCGVALNGSPGVPAGTPVEQLTPAQWGDRVRKASSATRFPRISIWHGTVDHVVNPQAQVEMIEQWTNLLGVSSVPQVDERFKTTRRQVFRDGSGRAVVEAFTVQDMDHGTPIDPGSASDQCGTSLHDQYIIAAGICSSFYIAQFWGL